MYFSPNSTHHDVYIPSDTTFYLNELYNRRFIFVTLFFNYIDKLIWSLHMKSFAGILFKIFIIL